MKTLSQEIECFLAFFRQDAVRAVARLDADFMLSDGKINYATLTRSLKMIEPGATKFFKHSDAANGQVLLGKSASGWFAIAYDGAKLAVHLPSPLARDWYGLCYRGDLNLLDWLLAGEFSRAEEPELAEAA